MIHKTNANMDKLLTASNNQNMMKEKRIRKNPTPLAAALIAEKFMSLPPRGGRSLTLYPLLTCFTPTGVLNTEARLSV